MSFHLDYLLDLPGVKVETCTQIEGQIYFQLSVVASGIICPHCNNYTEELHQNRSILARDLSVFGRSVYLQVPRRQFYCPTCQRYSTEKLEFLDKKRRLLNDTNKIFMHVFKNRAYHKLGEKKD